MRYFIYLFLLLQLTKTDMMTSKVEFEMVTARYERLIADRPLLLSSVLLRQNPHNVHEWHKRVKLFPDDPVMVS